MPPPGLTYLVCATHRSGSNLLCQMLWHTGLAGYPQEAFSPTRMGPIAAELSLPADPAVDFPGYVRSLMAARQTPNGVFGAKMMWKHLAPFCAAFHGNPARPWETLLSALPDLRCVWMRRHDALRQAISLVKAKQTKVFNSLQIAGDDPRRLPPVAYDYDSINKEYLRFVDEDRLWETFFHDSGITPVVLTYEDFVASFDRHIRDILRHLGQSIPDDFRCPGTSYTRQSDATNDEWAERFQHDRAARAKLPRSA